MDHIGFHCIFSIFSSLMFNQFNVYSTTTLHWTAGLENGWMDECELFFLFFLLYLFAYFMLEGMNL